MRFEFGRDRVLVIEDDPEVQIALYRLLRREGYSVTLAPSRRDALWCLQAVPVRPSVILVDVLMRDLSGQEFRQQLDRNPSWSDVPIIVLPARRDVSGEARAIGALAALRRPLDGRQLHAILGRVLPRCERPVPVSIRVASKLLATRHRDPLCSSALTPSPTRTTSSCKSKIS